MRFIGLKFFYCKDRMLLHSGQLAVLAYLPYAVRGLPGCSARALNDLDLGPVSGSVQAHRLLRDPGVAIPTTHGADGVPPADNPSMPVRILYPAPPPLPLRLSRLVFGLLTTIIVLLSLGVPCRRAGTA
jgi:hypothetical protein